MEAVFYSLSSQVKADRPFVIIIQANNTVLFEGTVIDPEQAISGTKSRVQETPQDMGTETPQMPGKNPQIENNMKSKIYQEKENGISVKMSNEEYNDLYGRYLIWLLEQLTKNKPSKDQANTFDQKILSFSEWYTYYYGWREYNHSDYVLRTSF